MGILQKSTLNIRLKNYTISSKMIFFSFRIFDKHTEIDAFDSLVKRQKCKSSSYNAKPNFCEIKQVNTKGNQYWIFIGRTDVEAEALILSPLDM